MKNLMRQDDVIHFGDTVKNETLRKTIVAAIYNPKTQLFLCQYWAEYNGLTTLLSGGIEKDEDVSLALSREIEEETGYKEYKVHGLLGGVIYSHYHKPTTNESFVKEIIPVAVSLVSGAAGKTNLEDDEKFENYFKPLKEIISMMEKYEQLTSSTMDDHKEVLKRADQYFNHQ